MKTKHIMAPLFLSLAMASTGCIAEVGADDVSLDADPTSTLAPLDDNDNGNQNGNTGDSNDNGNQNGNTETSGYGGFDDGQVNSNQNSPPGADSGWTVEVGLNITGMSPEAYGNMRSAIDGAIAGMMGFTETSGAIAQGARGAAVNAAAQAFGGDYDKGMSGALAAAHHAQQATLGLGYSEGYAHALGAHIAGSVQAALGGGG